MELLFENTQALCFGGIASAIHTPDNTVQVIFTDPGGDGIYAMDAATPMGQWANLEFSPAYMICSDTNVDKMKLKNVASSIFVVWRNPTDPGEVVPYQKGVTHTIRHRFAVWEQRQDLSKYLINGSVDFRLDDPVTKLDVNFENPQYIVSHEDDTILTPGTSLALFFRAGDSARYPMGKYYVDRNSMGVTEANTSVSCRNAIGKLLKDQTFDTDNNYPVQNMKTMVDAIMKSFSLTNYFVGDTTANLGMIFPPDMSGLDGLKEIIKTTTTWILSEDMTGRVGFGDKSDSRFPQASTYTFYRDKDIFSRNVERDDADAYSRVCVFNQDRSIQVYRDINFKFVMGKKKTLHASIADGTTLADAQAYADQLASLLGSVGVIETFAGPFRPHLLVGDNAEIVTRGNKLLGMITGVRHSFGKNGFMTEFTVDSGSVANKTRVSDLINKIAGRQSNGQVQRLY